MTGIAALMTGRRARLADLSPAAVHIAANYTRPCDPVEFQRGVERVLALVGPELEELYRSDVDGAEATVEYVVWSDVRSCPQCNETIVLADVRASGLRRLTCSGCGHAGRKTEFIYVGERPVETSLSAGWSPRRIVRNALPQDTAEAVEIPVERWHPTDAFDRTRPMWRRSHEDMGITTVDRFFSKRNLAAIAALWWATGLEPNERVRSALRFSLTAIINRASRRYQWNAKRPTNVLGGTLYISSMRYEWNVLSLWRRKVAAVQRLFASGLGKDGVVEVARESATKLRIPSASVDYCFTDPPFGAHIVYSDVSLLWEAWLGDFTDRQQEAIVVSGGDTPKGVRDYTRLLAEAFQEIHRVLKPDGRATVVFQSTDEAVWAAIMAAAKVASMYLVEAATLNKGQPSFKQIKSAQGGERVAHSDVVLTFARHRVGSPAALPDVHDLVAEEIRAAQAQGDAVNLGHLYAVVAAAQLSAGQHPLPFDAVSAIVSEKREPVVGIR
jgi:adenine-specific DNA methylase